MILAKFNLQIRRVLAGVSCVALAFAGCSGSPLAAITFPQVLVKQAVASYHDNAGQSRSKAGMDFGANNFSLSLARERVSDANWRENKYLQSVYGAGSQGVRLNDTWNLSASNELLKLTDIRAAVGGSSDGVIKSQNFGAGVSQWFIHETLQAGLDVSRTEVQRPEYEILDFDATVLTAPPQVTSNGTTMSLRHLSTPTTMTLASASFNDGTGRPLARFYHAGVRQYLPRFSGALHAAVYRGVNQGSLSTKTLYGEVTSWSSDLAWVQEFGLATQLRAGWRVHQEREVGRAYGDETQFGSDLFSLGVVHDAKVQALSGRILTLEAGFSRYLSNQDLMATTANFGVSGKF